MLVESITVLDLIDELKKFPDDYRVFTSVDTEGNSYGSLDLTFVEKHDDDGVVIIYPMGTHEPEDVLPNELEDM